MGQSFVARRNYFRPLTTVLIIFRACFVRFGCWATSDEVVEASSLYTNRTGGAIGGGSLTKSAMRGLFAKVPLPLELAFRMLDSKRRVFTRLTSSLSPVSVRPVFSNCSRAITRNNKRDRSISMTLIERKAQGGHLHGYRDIT